MPDVYNSAYTGTQIDAAIGAVRNKEEVWDAKQSKLTGSPGQVVGFDDEGDAIATPAPSGLPDGGTTGQILTQGADGPEWADPPDTGVTTFNNRSGAVTPQAGDYSADMIEFVDGETFQQKYDAGELTGPRGEQGSKGDTGAPGADGGYYTPAVSDSGDLTWTASKSGMPAVSGVNIRGPRGEQGLAGQDGAQGPAGADGAPGAAATINGVNALTLNATGGLSGSQSGSTYTLDGSAFVQKTANLSGTDYTAIRARGIQLVSSAPGTLPNGCIAIVYS